MNYRLPRAGLPLLEISLYTHYNNTKEYTTGLGGGGGRFKELSISQDILEID